MEYSDYFVAFLDVLGFKELVLSQDRAKVTQYLEKTKSIIDEIRKIKARRKLSAITISDSIILSIPFGAEKEENISNLRQLCVAIQKIQFELALEKIWVRGAISFGDAFISDEENQIVGPAYINAYSLEKTVAVYPRVILDNRLIDQFDMRSAQGLIDAINAPGRNPEYCPARSNILYEWYHQGAIKYGLERDVAFFIDFMIFCFTKEDALPKVIVNLEQSMYKNGTAYPKYRWLVDYLISSCIHHNNFICGIDRTVLREQLERLKKL